MSHSDGNALETMRKEVDSVWRAVGNLSSKLSTAAPPRAREGGIVMDLSSRDLRHFVERTPGQPDECVIRSAQTGHSWKAARDDLVIRWPRPLDGSDDPDIAEPARTGRILSRIQADVDREQARAQDGFPDGPERRRISEAAQEIAAALMAESSILPDEARACIERGNATMILAAADRTRPAELLIEEPSINDVRIRLLKPCVATRMLAFLGVQQELDLGYKNAATVFYGMMFQRVRLDPSKIDPIAAVRGERKWKDLLSEIRRPS